MKKLFSIVLALCLGVLAPLSIVACGAKSVKGTIRIDKKLVALSVGGTATISASFIPEKEGADVSGVVFSWKSDNPSIASVDASGLVTAKALGETAVTISYGKTTATCQVLVFDPEQREVVTATNARINISTHQDKKTINLKKAFSYLYDEDALVEILDEDGNSVPFTAQGDDVTVTWTGDVGMHTWVFLTAKKAITAEVCHATHIIAELSDFGPISEDWDEATLGNVEHLWAYENDTKDWYVVLDANIVASGGDDVSFAATYTFGHNFAADAPLDEVGDPIGGDERYAVFNGTFDGRGYSILGLNTQAGLIANLGATGVIKNLAMIDARNGRNFSSGILGLRGCGTIENVFIEGQLREWSTSAAGLYVFADPTHNLKVKDTIVVVNLYRGTWPNTTRAPGIFCSTWIASKAIVENSFGISKDISVVDGAGTPTTGILYSTMQAWLDAGGYARFSGLWEIGQEDISFGGEQVYAWNENEE